MLNTKSCEIQLELLDSSSPPQAPCSLHSLIFVFVFVLNTHNTLTTLLVFSQTRVEKGTRKGATGCKRESVESQPKLKHERGGVVCRARRLPRDPGTLAPPCCLSPTALGPHGAISALDFLLLVITSEQDGYTPKCDRSLVLVLTKTLTFREGGGLALRRPAPKPPSGVAQLLRPTPESARRLSICPPNWKKQNKRHFLCTI